MIDLINEQKIIFVIVSFIIIGIIVFIYVLWIIKNCEETKDFDQELSGLIDEFELCVLQDKRKSYIHQAELSDDSGVKIKGYLIYDNYENCYRILQDVKYSTGSIVLEAKAPRVKANTIQVINND